MNNCKECDKPATIGSYCLAHHLERTNAIITAQFAIERATIAERERDEARAELERVKAERNRFADYLATIGYKPRCTCTMDDNMHEPSCNLTEWARIRFERTAPVDWRESEQETPFGQMLDGLGNEVEP